VKKKEKTPPLFPCNQPILFKKKPTHKRSPGKQPQKEKAKFTADFPTRPRKKEKKNFRRRVESGKKTKIWSG